MFDPQKEAQRKLEVDARLAQIKKAYEEDLLYTPSPRGAIRAGEECIAHGLYNAATMYFQMATAICLTRQEIRAQKRGRNDS